jgi:autotransporter-associated beta strand protein
MSDRDAYSGRTNLLPPTHMISPRIARIGTATMPTATRRSRVARVLLPLVFGALFLLSVGAPAARAADYTWNAGGGASTVWSNSLNWNPAGVPAFVAGDRFLLNTLDITTNSTSTVDFSATLGVITIGDTNATNSWTLAGSNGAVLTLDNSGVAAQINQVSTSKGDTISVPLALAGDLTINNASTTLANALTISGPISSAATSGTQTITVNSQTAGAVTLSGVISDGTTGGKIGLTVTNPLTTGTVINTVNISGNNTFSGPIVIGSGASGTSLAYLVVQSSNALGNASSITVNGTTQTGPGNRLSLGSGVDIVGKTLTLNPGTQRSSIYANLGNALWEGNIVVSGTGANQFYSDASGVTLTIGNAAGTNTISGTASSITIRGASGTGIIRSVINLPSGSVGKTDSGTWVIASTGNTWLNTTVAVGTFRTDVSNALPATTVVQMGQGDTNTPTFNLNGTNQTIGGLTLNSGTSGNKTVTNTAATLSTLTLNNAATDFTYGVTNPQFAVVTGNLQFVKGGAAAFTFAGTTTFTGGLVVNAGTVNVGGTATYTGGNTVNGGTLKAVTSLGNTANTLTVNGGAVDLNGQSVSVGNLTGTGGTVSNGNLTIGTNNTGGGTFAGVLADPLTLTKVGTGTVTLTGANTYTGPTNVTAGTLAFGASAYPASSPLNLGLGAGFSLVNGTANNLTTLSGLTLGAGGSGAAVIALELGTPAASDALGTPNGASAGGTVRFDITNLTGFGAGTYTLLTAAGGLGGATYQVGSFPSGFGYTLTPSDTSVQLTVFAITPTTGPIFFTGAGSTSWIAVTAGNSQTFATTVAGTTPSVGTPNPTNTVTFSSTAGTVTGPTTFSTLDGNFTINDLVFNNQTQGGAITAVQIDPGSVPTNTLTIAPTSPAVGITVQTGAPPLVTINAPVAVGAAQTWTIADAGSVLVIGGAVSGSANLTKAGAGTVRFVDPNFAGYTGAIAVNAGTLEVQTNAVAATLANTLSGAGLLLKTGTNALTLTGNNTNTGGVTLTGGTLNLNTPTALGTGTFTVGDGTTVGNSSGAAVTLTTNNPQVWGGTITKTGNDLNLGTGAVTLAAGVTVNVSANTLTVGGVIGDGGNAFGLTKSGAGTLVLTAANTFTGPTNLTAGTTTLSFLADGGAPSPVGASSNAAGNFTIGGTVNVNATSTTDRAIVVGAAARIVQPNSATTLTLNGPLSGSQTLSIGPNNTAVGMDTTVVLRADNSAFTGGVTLNNGTLVVTNSTALGTGTKTVTVQVNTTGFVALQLNPQGGPDINLPSTFSYTTSATVVNGGIVNVAGSNTVGGNFTLTSGNGATSFQSDGGTITFTGTIAPNTTSRVLQLRGNSNGVISGTIQDGSTTNTLAVSRLEGTGTWTLTGNNTYTVGTTVSFGTLLANGQVAPNSGTGTGPVDVQGGATSGGVLGGNGRVAGLVTVNTTGGTFAATLRPGDATAVGTLELGGGLTVAAGGRVSFRITDASTPAAANTGGSTLGTLPNPTSNNFINITGGTTTVSSGTVIVLDGTGVTFTPGASYSYHVGQGAGGQSFTITNPSQFALTNVPADPASLSFTGTATGDLYVNFTAATPVPEPATALGVGLAGWAGLAAVRRRRRGPAA